MSNPTVVKPTLSGLLGLAWPIIVSRSTQVVVGLADALMVAHLGVTALAAVTAGALNSFAVFIFPMGIAFVVASFSSQLTGKGDPVSARRYGWYGLGVAAMAQGLAFLLIPFLPEIYVHFGYEADVTEAMCAYLSIRLLSTGAGVGIEALGNYYSGLGNTSILMKTNLAAMVLNVGFNWLLIDGNLGFPALGYMGAAWGSLLAVSSAFLGFLTVFLLHGKGLGPLGLKLREFLRLMKFGLPSGLNWSFEFFAFILFVNVVVATLGTTSLAAFMAVLQVNSVSFMPAFGLGSAGAILVGQCIGAGNKDQVPSVVKMTFLTAAAWMGLVGLAYLAVPRLFLAPFVPGDGSDGGVFLAAGISMLMLSALWQVFDAAGITVSEALRAAGDTAFPMWARAVLAWGVFLPGSWVTIHHFGGAELSAIGWLLAYLGLLALVIYWRFRQGAWRKIQLVEEMPVV